MNIIQVNNIKGYISNDIVWLNAEDVARGFGFIQTKGNVTYVRWGTINSYLNSFGFSQQVGKEDYIPENMVYRLGFKANNEVALKFQSLLADEVLPSIRKTGGYIAASENESDEEIMAKALRIAEQTLARREQRIRQLNDKVVELTSTVEVMKPKANYFDIIMNCKSTVTTTQIAQDYGMSAKRFNMLLNEFRVQRKVNGQWILYNRYIGQGYVHSKPVDIIRSNGMRDVKYNTEWTQKGRIFLYGILKDNGIIPMIEKS